MMIIIMKMLNIITRGNSVMMPESVPYGEYKGEQRLTRENCSRDFVVANTIMIRSNHKKY